MRLLKCIQISLGMNLFMRPILCSINLVDVQKWQLNNIWSRCLFLVRKWRYKISLIMCNWIDYKSTWKEFVWNGEIGILQPNKQSKIASNALQTICLFYLVLTAELPSKKGEYSQTNQIIEREGEEKNMVYKSQKKVSIQFSEG